MKEQMYGTDIDVKDDMLSQYTAPPISDDTFLLPVEPKAILPNPADTSLVIYQPKVGSLTVNTQPEPREHHVINIPDARQNSQEPQLQKSPQITRRALLGIDTLINFINHQSRKNPVSSPTLALGSSPQDKDRLENPSTPLYSRRSVLHRASALATAAAVLAACAPNTIIFGQLPGKDKRDPPKLSRSKLGVFFLTATPDAKEMAMAGPRVIKVIDPQMHPEMMELSRNYLDKYPDGKLLLRIAEDSRLVNYDINYNPKKAAEDYWDKVLYKAGHLFPNDRDRVFLTGPNGYENIPGFDTVDEAKWSGSFYAHLARIIRENGFRPILGEFPVGGPEPYLLEYFVPALREIQKGNGMWSMQGYSLEYTTEIDTEKWTSLRFISFLNYLKQNYPDVADVPLIITEGGVDLLGDGQTDGWLARGDNNKYLLYLRWLDQTLQSYPTVLGETIFQCCNDQEWKSFNLAPFKDNYQSLLKED